MTNPTTTTTTTTTTPVIPSEVGWQFVPQYYTFVNKQPNRLHCFYTKASTFIHGTEGEDGKPCFGQQEIHNKITSIGFQDCKVFIHSVDAQSSAAGGIIIQVIGEMSNHGDPWRKFVQTFFLAEQPNGYFVLNDIFRFLKEETVDSDEGEAEAETVAPTLAPEPVPTASPAPAAESVLDSPRESSPLIPAATLTPAAVVPPPVEEAPTTDVPEPSTTVEISTPASEPTQTPAAAAVPQLNGVHNTEHEKSIPVVAALEKSPVPTPAPQAVRAPSPTPVVPVATTSTPTPPPPAQAPAPVPSPAPAAPFSWATLAASNPKKWGTAVALDARGVTETPAPTSSGTYTPPAGGSGAGSRGPSHHYHQQSGAGTSHPAYATAQNITIAQCFVKGVTEPVSNQALTTALTQRFGPIKDLEIVRTKACAFLEFLSLDAAKRAITVSLPQSQGGEGGVWIDVGGEAGNVRISVETKKERGDRPVSRPRGGAPPVNGEGRGGGSGYRGGRGGQGGRGRGVPAGGK